jgi:hypothetical protein
MVRLDLPFSDCDHNLLFSHLRVHSLYTHHRLHINGLELGN